MCLLFEKPLLLGSKKVKHVNPGLQQRTTVVVRSNPIAPVDTARGFSHGPSCRVPSTSALIHVISQNDIIPGLAFVGGAG